MTFRDQKRAARRVVHSTMAEPCLFLKSRRDAPVGVTCRLHLQFGALGDLLATRVGFAEREEVTPSIIFLNAEGAEPVNNSVVITRDMGAYRVGQDYPPDDITTKVDVARIMDEDLVKYGWDPKALWCGFAPPAGA